MTVFALKFPIIVFLIHQVNELKSLMRSPKYWMLKKVSVLPTYLIQGI